MKYLKKLQNMAEFLIRGNQIQSPDEEYVIEIVNNEITAQRGAFSVKESNVYDSLEQYFYGEQQSIDFLISLIEDGEYERQVEAKVDFSKPYIPPPEDERFYKTTMKKVREIIKYMALSLASGSRIPLSKKTAMDLQQAYLGEDESIEEIFGSIVYNYEQQKFQLIDEDKEVIVEKIDINDAMSLYSKFLIQQEREKLSEITIKRLKDKKEAKKPEQSNQEEREPLDK